MTPDVPTTLSEKLALERTSLAYDRTLLAWVRTAIGIIGFGFSFYKFFEFMAESQKVELKARLLSPRDFALILIVSGNIALLLATIQTYQARKTLRSTHPEVPRSTAVPLAVFIFAFGAFALVATALRF